VLYIRQLRRQLTGIARKSIVGGEFFVWVSEGSSRLTWIQHTQTTFISEQSNSFHKSSITWDAAIRQRFSKQPCVQWLETGLIAEPTHRMIH